MKARVSLLLLVFLSVGRPLYAGQPDPEAMYYVNAYADHYGVPRALVYAVIDQESGWNPRAVSNKGAMGLGQLMPATARRYGVGQPFLKSDNIGGCVRYLWNLLVWFHGDMRLAVAAYYTGETRVARHGLSLRDPDVLSYVLEVRRRYLRELRIFNSFSQEEYR